MAMGGMFQPTDLRLAWPTVEAGGMALEGAAALIQRRQDAGAVPADEPGRDADDVHATRRRRDEMAAELRAHSLAISAARRYAYDEVIDPAETRDRIIRMLDLMPKPPGRERKKHYIDTW